MAPLARSASANIAARCTAGIEGEDHVVALHAAPERAQLALEEPGRSLFGAGQIVVLRALQAGAIRGRRRVPDDLREQAPGRIRERKRCGRRWSCGGDCGQPRAVGARISPRSMLCSRTTSRGCPVAMPATARPTPASSRSTRERDEERRENDEELCDLRVHACAPTRVARCRDGEQERQPDEFASIDEPP